MSNRKTTHLSSYKVINLAIQNNIVKFDII